MFIVQVDMPCFVDPRGMKGRRGGLKGKAEWRWGEGVGGYKGGRQRYRCKKNKY